MLEAFKTQPEDPEELRSVSAQMLQYIQSQAYQIEKLKAELHGHRKARLGSKAEAMDQLALDLSEDGEIAQAAADQYTKQSPGDDEAPTNKRQHSRKPLPDHLDRENEVLSPGEACAGCAGTLRQVGENVTEELDYILGHFVVRRFILPRMACTCCEAFAQAPLPSRLIERGRPGPGLVSHMLVSKYCDHLPLERQSKIYAREGVDLHRSTLSNRVGRITALLEPMAGHICKLVRAGPALFADDTPVKLQVRANTTKTKTARLWSYVRDERPWCGAAPPCAWYQFSVDRKGQHPANHLAGYTGTVHANGYAKFNGLFGTGKASEQACMVYVRRKFVDELERTGSPIARQAIKQIAQLYAVEKEVRGKSPEERVALWQVKAKPVFDELELRLQAQLRKISGKTKLAEAIHYALNRMPKARGYLGDGRLELDNNTCEWSIRPIALDRKTICSWGQPAAGRLPPFHTRSSRPPR
ncbi:IS66 family transposase [Paracoccus sp. JM45]|uniref:IS66 family transposase n=1 Tax=Paracoccus sp. JM45 TaxID=2283626 RepID=UPI002107D678|nr:IS66 family transposase [Paracoccus sp. JM45]